MNRTDAINFFKSHGMTKVPGMVIRGIPLKTADVEKSTELLKEFLLKVRSAGADITEVKENSRYVLQFGAKEDKVKFSLYLEYLPTITGKTAWVVVQSIKR